ncbi:MAG: bifunctional N(6)-L-threonylcarbamoyladenine synthase/serine/threonine protein kinase [Candidatus Woesearchaeota archaeon]|nr:bifunctional N(6)-L-threonylcarbamoyladenine synthase/serine/threonine protein kinase [Candidatus Woesearchaeota archaeon]
MICLGIESTAHTFGVGIVKEENREVSILANVKSAYTSEKEGIIPWEAAEHHSECFDSVIRQALSDANVSFSDIDLISFSQGPGLGPCLRVGAFVARTLSVLLDKPLIGVNHCIAHLEIGRLVTDSKDPVLMYASGANTQIIAFEGGRYRIFGETLDMGIGNMIDTFARKIGMGFPGGPKVYQLSLEGKNYIELPYVVKGMDVSFSGILTNIGKKYESREYSVPDLCYSLQETVFAMLVEVSERAIAHCGKSELLMGGGVACNKRLFEMAKKMCDERGAKCFSPLPELLVDNGAMISWLGLLEHQKGARQSLSETAVRPYERTDDIDAFWHTAEKNYSFRKKN